MVERDGGRAPHARHADESLRELATELGRLAEEAKHPYAAERMPGFADELARIAAAVSQHAGELALARQRFREAQAAAQEQAAQVAAEAALEAAESAAALEAAGWTGDDDAALAGADGPRLAGVRAAETEPLTWRAVAQAVEGVYRALVVPVPDAATTDERLATATEAHAARMVRRLFEHTAAYIGQARLAYDFHQSRGAASPSVDASLFVADGAARFLNGFSDLRDKGAGRAPAALAMALLDVQAGKQAAFTKSVARVPRPPLRNRDAAIRGTAAVSMDARMRADPKNSREDAGSHVAAILNEGNARRARSDPKVTGATVAGWRDCAALGDAGKPKGWKAGEALRIWQSYMRNVVEAHGRGLAFTHEQWALLADLNEARLAELLGLPAARPVRERRPSRPERRLGSKG